MDGRTNSIGTPLAFSCSAKLKFCTPMSISPCWNSAPWAPKLADTAARFGSSVFSLAKPGVMSFSLPPARRLMSSRKASPSVLASEVMPTRPLNSGRHRSSQEVGGVFTVLGLYAMPIACIVTAGP